MTRIYLDHVTKIFGKPPKQVIAVNDVELEIKDREFMVLLGPSGCGKTTTLRLIAGLERPSRGKVLFDDEDVTHLTPRERDVAMVFQSYAVYPHMKVFDNIAFPLKLRKLPKDEIRKKVKEIAEKLQIDHLLERYPGELSGGQLQRVALARALVRNPRVFLLDEPLSNLDAKIRVETRGFIKRLQKDIGVTTVYVTHDQSEAMVLADRIAVLNQGILQQVGTPSELYESPANMFVGGFIGTPPMNFIEGTLIEDNNGILMLDIGYSKIPMKEFTGIQQLRNYLNKTIVMGIRPDNIKVYRLSEAVKCGIKGKVYVEEYLGNIAYSKIMLSENIVIQGVSVIPGLRIGEDVCIDMELNKAHIFDPSTTKLIV
ncbi:MAG: ABC transporter ATP-binding protein [Desulfurococcaceae archaeon]